MKYTAEKIAADVAAAYRKFGRQASVPYTQTELLETIAQLVVARAATGDVLKEELTKARRQYAALNARYTKLKNKHGVKNDDESETT